MTIQLTEPELNQIVAQFKALKKKNLNHNPKCPYAFEVPNPDPSWVQRKPIPLPVAREFAVGDVVSIIDLRDGTTVVEKTTIIRLTPSDISDATVAHFDDQDSAYSTRCLRHVP